jgi:CheY-like chemotaxis protein
VQNKAGVAAAGAFMNAGFRKSLMIKDPSCSTRARIVLAEDDRTTARLIEIALQRSGYPHQLDIAHDGAEAISAIERTAADLLILDLHMPAKNGFEVLEHLKKRDDLRRTPVVMFSSSALPADVDRAYRLHVNAYVIKPANLPDMCRTMDALLQFWLGTVTLGLAHSWKPCSTEE